MVVTSVVEQFQVYHPSSRFFPLQLALHSTDAMILDSEVVLALVHFFTLQT